MHIQIPAVSLIAISSISSPLLARPATAHARRPSTPSRRRPVIINGPIRLRRCIATRSLEQGHLLAREFESTFGLVRALFQHVLAGEALEIGAGELFVMAFLLVFQVLYV